MGLIVLDFALLFTVEKVSSLKFIIKIQFMTILILIENISKYEIHLPIYQEENSFPEKHDYNINFWNFRVDFF